MGDYTSSVSMSKGRPRDMVQASENGEQLQYGILTIMTEIKNLKRCSEERRNNSGRSVGRTNRIHLTTPVSLIVALPQYPHESLESSWQPHLSGSKNHEQKKRELCGLLGIVGARC